MKSYLPSSRFCLLLLAAMLLSWSAIAQPLSFPRAIELALAHSGTVVIAQADQMRARQEYLQARNQFLPQMVVGSGLAYSLGFPLSLEGAAPAVISLGSQQFLINPAQRQFMRASESEWRAASRQSDDRRSQVVLETALTYLELDKVTAAANLLGQQESSAKRVEQVVLQRISAGVESQVGLTRARLNTARLRLRLAESQGAVDLLRRRLAQLTGLPAASIETSTETIPRLPEVNQDEDLAGRAVESSSAVKSAQDHAAAREFRARGERRQLYPAIDLVAQYAVLSKFNNYQDFFVTFKRHNVTAGVAIRFPFLNFAQKAAAEAAEAEALKARRQAEEVKDLVSNEATRLQRSLRQLAAAREVARLEHQLALTDFQTVQANLETGNATIRDQENARIQENQRYAAFLDANFELEKAQMQLLRATGDLENWAMGKR